MLCCMLMGVSVRAGDELFFGDLTAQRLQQAQCSLLFVSGGIARAAQVPR